MSFSTKLRQYGPPVVVGTGLAVLVASIVSMARHGFDSPIAMDNVYRMLERAGDVGRIEGGFAPFGTATAYTESRFNPGALNSDSVENSCELYDASGGIYANNPYGRQAFCIGAGGLYGFFPATGMKPKVFRNLDPDLIFDPAASSAMLADYVVRIVRNYFHNLPPEHRNWLAIRRSMAGLAVMYDYDESGDRSREVKSRFASALSAIGVDPDLMYDHPQVGDYPGAAVVWDSLT